MKNRKLLAVLTALTVLGTTAVGLWVAGLRISGNLTATSGTPPTAIEFTQDINISSNANYTFSKIYHNSDGVVFMSFTLDDSSIHSTDPKCNYEHNLDLLWEIDTNGYTTFETIPTMKRIEAGDNNITIQVQPSPYRCPLTGIYTITGVLI